MKSRNGMTVTWQSRADFESGIGAFRILRNGKIIGQLPAASTSRYGRPLFQRMSYHDTPEAPLPKMHFIDTDGTTSDQYTVQAVNSVGLVSD